MNKTCLITNDVETTSIINHRLDDTTGQIVALEGIPRLLDLYQQHNVRATFFFTGHFAQLFPSSVRLVSNHGHEIGSHGLNHDVAYAFDVLSHREQLQHLTQSKQILEDILGKPIVSFRAPAARVPKDFPNTLKEAGFMIDSSVSSQRMDMFLSFGSKNKLHWFTSPRKAYTTSPTNIFHKGDNGIFEIPITAFGIPYIGTALRIAPLTTRISRRLLHLETLLTDRQFVFLTHPNEFIDEQRDATPIKRRTSNPLAYLLGDVIRHALKVRNLGQKALPLYDHELQFFNHHHYQYLTCSEFMSAQLSTNS